MRLYGGLHDMEYDNTGFSTCTVNIIYTDNNFIGAAEQIM